MWDPLIPKGYAKPRIFHPSHSVTWPSVTMDDFLAYFKQNAQKGPQGINSLLPPTLPIIFVLSGIPTDPWFHIYESLTSAR